MSLNPSGLTTWFMLAAVRKDGSFLPWALALSRPLELVREKSQSVEPKDIANAL